MAPEPTAPASARERVREILEVVQVHASEQAYGWLQKGLQDAFTGGQLQRGLFFGFFAGTGRRFGHERPSLGPDAVRRLQDAGIAISDGLTLSDLCRIALLLAALDALPGGEHVSLLREAFQKGDSHERVAVLKSLSTLPGPERFLEIGVEAVRSHVQDVFEGIACDNPYPAAFFPESAFNQLITKAMFVDVPLARVHAWQTRNNDELRRMAHDFAAERSAAGRPVPADVDLVTSTE